MATHLSLVSAAVVKLYIVQATAGFLVGFVYPWLHFFQVL